jgi:transposase
MRGKNDQQQAMMFVVAVEEMIPASHPIRAIKQLADTQLASLDGVFSRMYSTTGRPSIPPEALLKAGLLMALYSIRSERQLCEQLQYNFLFRWFLDLGVNDAVFDPSTFSQNRERILKEDVARQFFDGIVSAARGSGLLSSEHFTVDGTLIEACASLKSFKAKGAQKDNDDNKKPPQSRNEEVSFHGEKRSNTTHASSTDPQALLAKKGAGKEAKLSFSAHVLMENRNGLCVDIKVAQATGTAEIEQSLELIRRQKERGVPIKTIGGDKFYDQKPFVGELRKDRIVPHVAAKKSCSAIDQRTTRHKTYEISQRIRKRIEEIFGWMKTIGGFGRTRYRGVERTGLSAYLVASAYNLVRISKMMKVA